MGQTVSICVDNRIALFLSSLATTAAALHKTTVETFQLTSNCLSFRA
jgi:hypothetical protein